jgi:ankyrin repeat protein
LGEGKRVMNKNSAFLVLGTFVSLMNALSLFAAHSQPEKEDKTIEILTGGIFLPQDPHPLHAAIKKEDLKQIEGLLDKHLELLYTTDQDGNTPLHLAAEQGNQGIVDVLLKKYEAIPKNSKLKKRILECLTKLNKKDQSAAALAQEKSDTGNKDKQIDFYAIAIKINASAKYIRTKK